MSLKNDLANRVYLINPACKNVRMKPQVKTTGKRTKKMQKAAFRTVKLNFGYCKKQQGLKSITSEARKGMGEENENA